MVEVLVLSERDVRGLHDEDALAEALREAFRSISAGTASVPARVAAFSEAGLLGAMPGFVPGLAMGAKLVAYFRHNEARGVPSHQAVVTLVDPETGTLLAIMDGTFITATRTATAAAVAAVELARPEAATVAIIGSGVQARSHLDAFTQALRPAEIRISARNPDRAEALADTSDLARPVAQSRDAVAGADVVCLCTDADEPVISRPWLAEGTHVSSVGVGVEVDPATMAEAAVFVESRAAATQPFPAGSQEIAGWDPDQVTEVGEVLLGSRPGRVSAQQLTVYKSMGHAAEDLAAASVVYRAARAQGVGTTVEL